jgi:uncharacterized protein (TIGR00251 family)
MRSVLVKPGAKKTVVTKLPDGTLAVRVVSRAEKGKANKAVIEALADYFQVSPSKIVLEKGESSKRKLVSIKLD